jgi:predicted benzoate:H+ symporter BenE
MRNAVSSVMFMASLANSHTCVEMLEAAFTAGAIVLLLALSSLSLGGFGPGFWALLIGMAVSLLLEQSELRSLRADA